jgi:hypothetical protein
MATAHDHRFVEPRIYRGWDIEPGYIGWQGTHPDYDPTPLHADDSPGDNRHVHGETASEVMNEIDLWIEENE